VGHGRRNKTRRQQKEVVLPEELQRVNLNAAGIDIGARCISVAVPRGRDAEGQDTREFDTFMPDLSCLADWLEQCGVETVAMESTGVYWIPLYELLEERGFEVYLVDARKVKNVSGRKDDDGDAEWLQKLHTFGLLSAAFRPVDSICVVRAYQRQRTMLVNETSRHIQHMHKALTQMGLQVQHAIRDITGVTGMKIVRCILRGERDPESLVQHRDPRCKASHKTLLKALEGNYRPEHVFSLKQAVELYDFYQEKIRDCDRELEQKLSEFEDRSNGKQLEPRSRQRRGNEPDFDLRGYLFCMAGVDLTALPGLDSYSVLQLVSETGIDMSAWRNGKKFTNWLGLSPNHKSSGGKIYSRGTQPNANRAATVFRLAARSAGRSRTAIGAFYRRIKARRGAPKAITATARKIALIYYSMLRFGTEYVELGQDWYEEQYRTRVVRNLERRAKSLGFQLVAVSEPAVGSC
jgi:transposase